MAWGAEKKAEADLNATKAAAEKSLKTAERRGDSGGETLILLGEVAKS